MNNRKAKQIRREVYGDGSKHNAYRYVRQSSSSNTLICVGLRKLYLDKKKEYMS